MEAAVSREKVLLAKQVCVSQEWPNEFGNADFSSCGPWDSAGLSASNERIEAAGTGL